MSTKLEGEIWGKQIIFFGKNKKTQKIAFCTQQKTKKHPNLSWSAYTNLLPYRGYWVPTKFIF